MRPGGYWGRWVRPLMVMYPAFNLTVVWRGVYGVQLGRWFIGVIEGEVKR